NPAVARWSAIEEPAQRGQPISQRGALARLLDGRDPLGVCGLAGAPGVEERDQRLDHCLLRLVPDALHIAQTTKIVPPVELADQRQQALQRQALAPGLLGRAVQRSAALALGQRREVEVADDGLVEDAQDRLQRRQPVVLAHAAVAGIDPCLAYVVNRPRLRDELLDGRSERCCGVLWKGGS